jgi:dsDNA-specific endonuclease/ATPase MutS2
MKYYSEILNKNFDTEEDCVKAEKEHTEAETKKAEAKALVKKESAVVEDAFKARNEARLSYNQKLVELRKTYNQKISEAKKEFDAGLEEIYKPLETAEKDYDAKLREFQKNHPEGYHLTLHDGDNVMTLTGNHGVFEKTLDDEFNNMLDLFNDFLKRW